MRILQLEDHSARTDTKIRRPARVATRLSTDRPQPDSRCGARDAVLTQERDDAIDVEVFDGYPNRLTPVVPSPAADASAMNLGPDHMNNGVAELAGIPNRPW